MEQLTNIVETSIGHAPVVAGTTDVSDCEVIDMQGFEGVRVLIGFGTITSGAVTSVKMEHADAKSSSTALTSGEDIEDSSISVADTEDSSVVIMDINKPQKRYLQPYIDRGTQNAVVDFVVYEKYGARKLPVTANADVSHQELSVSPASGTA